MKRTLCLLPMLGLLACSGSEQTDQSNAALEVYAAAQQAVDNGVCACAEAMEARAAVEPTDVPPPPDPEIPPPEEPLPLEPDREPPLPCEQPGNPEEPPLPCEQPGNPEEPPLPCEQPVPEEPLPCEQPTPDEPLPCERPGPEEAPLPCETPEEPPLPCEQPVPERPCEQPIEPPPPLPCELPEPIDPGNCPCADVPLPPCEAAFIGCIENAGSPEDACGAVLVECLGPEAPQVPAPMDCEKMREDCQSTIGDAALCDAEFGLCMTVEPPPAEIPTPEAPAPR